MSYRLTNRAVLELLEIQNFIAVEKQNPAGAEVVESYLFEAFRAIGNDPERCGGRLRPDITPRPYKFLTVRKYMVIFDDRTSPVLIVGVVGGRRNLAALLAPDAGLDGDNEH